MAHFARIADGVVQEVIKIENVVLHDADGIEQESIGAAFCADSFGGTWVQTSYNGTIRGKYAGVGDTWDGTNFVSPEPPVQVAP